ncbi:MAG: retroviral-like aspartic protease family protein [Anaerolineae bacterium]|nr:retroviral-like aspartic protease family protein [Anaerolineae bacterium]
MNEIIASQEYGRIAYDPPMPVLDIGVSRPGSSVPSATLEAVIDTGADGTLLPLDILEHINAAFVDRAYLRGITGQRQSVDLYLVTLHLGRLRIAGVRAAALAPGSTAILGRDVLNQLDIVLHGPAGVTEVVT